MSIKAILFDLDGTLLPMDQPLFVRTYFKRLTEKMVSYGYNPDDFISALKSGIYAMINNNGEQTNADVFWRAFAQIIGDKVYEDMTLFDQFYEQNFDDIKTVCGYDAKAADIIATVKSKGLRSCLATNPIFPSIATEKRVLWAGLNVDDFEFLTTYENSCFAKPNPEYYSRIAQRLGLYPDECVMVGNDTSDDLAAEKIGMKTFILTDCLINRENIDVSNYNNGNMSTLIEYINNL